MKHHLWKSLSAQLAIGVLALAQLLLTPSNASASLVAGWSFEGYDGTSTTVKADSGVQSGSALLAFDDFSGNTGSYTGINPVSGVNEGDDLAVKNDSNNGKSLTFKIMGAGYSDFVISYATRRSGFGFTDQKWAYSLNGTSFTTFGPAITPKTDDYGSETVNFSSIGVLNDQANIYFRVALDGASSSGGNNRFDNIQINADPAVAAVPESASTGVLSALFLAAVLVGEEFSRRTRLR